MRIYAGPVNVRVAGRWVTRASVERNTYDAATGIFERRIGDEYIRWIPEARADRDVLAAAKRFILTSERCGPILNAALALPAAISWRVETSRNVRRIADGWEFTSFEARVGLYFTEWIQASLSGAVAISDGRIVADLSKFRVANDEIDLDPTYASSESGYLQSVSSTGVSWPDVCAGTADQLSTVANNHITCAARQLAFKSPSYYSEHGMLDFATSGETAGSTAILTLKCKSFFADDNGHLYLRRIAAYAPLDAGDWNDSGGDAVTNQDMAGYSVGDLWEPDVTAHLQTDANTCFDLEEKHDTDLTAPVYEGFGTTFYGPDAAEADQPYLTITATAHLTASGATIAARLSSDIAVAARLGADVASRLSVTDVTIQ